MGIENVKEVEKVIEEIQEFTGFVPEGEFDSIAYLHKAREVINAYDRMVASKSDEGVYEEIELIRYYLKNYPHYLEFHSE
ncbi:MAG: hypothetical protein IKG56_03135 [Clostridia bacterium]|nr:hypothetical protein [Clostridia bacterium]